MLRTPSLLRSLIVGFFFVLTLENMFLSFDVLGKPVAIIPPIACGIGIALALELFRARRPERP